MDNYREDFNMIQVEIVHNTKWQWDILAREHFLIIDNFKKKGSENEGPLPEEIFLASIGGAVAQKISEFLEKNKIKTDEAIKLLCTAELKNNPESLENINIKIQFPANFSEYYKNKLINYTQKNSIINTLLLSPIIEISKED